LNVARAIETAKPFTARQLHWRFIKLYVLGSCSAVSITLLLALIGLGFSADQWLYFAYITLPVVSAFVSIDIYALNRHYRKLGSVLGELDAGRVPDNDTMAQGIVRALNMPYLSFLRVTFLHAPLAAIFTMIAMAIGNAFFHAGFAPWQIYTFGATIAFFSSPAHAIIEYFITVKTVTPVVEYLWQFCHYISKEHQAEVISIRLKNKLLYLSIFIAALPLLYFSATIIFKVALLFQDLNYKVTVLQMSPLVIWVVGVVLICSGGALAMSIMTASEVSRNALKLINAMNEVGVGNLDSTLKITGTDEYSELFRGFNRMTESLQEEVRILEISKNLAGELNLDELLKRIISATTELLDADRSTLMIYDPKTNELWSRYAEGINITEIRIPASQGIAGAVFTSGQVANITDAYQDPRFNQAVDKRTGYKTETILCMPIVSKTGEKLGVTQVLNKRGGVFTSKDEDRLGAFTAQISVALENAKLFEEVLNEKKYNDAIQKSTSSGVLTLDTQDQVLTANEAALEILKQDLDALLGRTVQTLFQKKNEWICNSIEKVKQTGEQEDVLDTELHLADGTTASVNMSAMPLIDVSNENIGIMLVLDDISSEKRMRTTMSRYMSAEVVDELLKSGESQLGGKNQVVSILFSDLRNFTTLSEQLGPRETVSMLNEYFEQMVDVIMGNKGVLDKYIGDAIMALFGVPFKGSYDADDAVKTANGMFRALRELNQARMSKNQFNLDIGVGISTGDVIVGNIGSPKRLEYTVIGDPVNLASRLEGVTKAYGAKILISEYTMNSLHDDYVLREIDVLRVKGQNTPVAIYEVLDHYTAQQFPCMHDVLKFYLTGYSAMRKRDWQSARQSFGAALQLHPGDKPSQTHLERIAYYIEHPPADDWDGVWVMTSK
jgi:adenylate cyclase